MRTRIRDKIIGFGTITYPAQPYDVGSKPRFDTSAFSYSPRVVGMRMLCHMETGRVFDRTGGIICPTITEKFDASLQKIHAKSPHPWVDCVAIASGPLVVIDLVDKKRVFRRRKAQIQKSFPILEIGEEKKLCSDDVYRLPEYSGKHIEFLQNSLEQANEDLGKAFYSGIVGKKKDAVYPMQLSNPEIPSKDWHQWLFPT